MIKFIVTLGYGPYATVAEGNASTRFRVTHGYATGTPWSEDTPEGDIWTEEAAASDIWAKQSAVGGNWT